MRSFYLCNHCKNLAALIDDKGVALVCCGEKMTGLAANTAEASAEKHLPAVSMSDGILTVEVGSVPHPMIEEHHIAWIYAETENGGQLKYLKAGDEPKAEFSFTSDKPVAAYEYCNLHGLWKTEL